MSPELDNPSTAVGATPYRGQDANLPVMKRSSRLAAHADAFAAVGLALSPCAVVALVSGGIGLAIVLGAVSWVCLGVPFVARQRVQHVEALVDPGERTDAAVEMVSGVGKGVAVAGVLFFVTVVLLVTPLLCVAV